MQTILLFMASPRARLSETHKFRIAPNSLGKTRFSAAAPLLWLLALVQISPVSRAAAAVPDPSYYQKKITWQDTLLCSLEALARLDFQDGFTPFESKIFRGGQAAQHLNIPLSGAQEMYLFVTGCPDVKWGVADWAGARLIALDGTITPLSSLKSLKPLLGRHELDLTLRSGLYQKMRLGDRTFDRGVQVQANSVLFVPLHGGHERFETWIGVDAWAGTNGSVRFSVVGARTAARKQLWELLARDFPQGEPRRQMAWEREDRIHEKEWPPGDYASIAKEYARASRRVPALAEKADALALAVSDKAGLGQVRELYYRSRQLDVARAKLKSYGFAALRLAIEDLINTFGQKYPKGREFRERLNRLERAASDALSQNPLSGLPGGAVSAGESVVVLLSELDSLKREALLANPSLDFDRLLVVKRKPIGDPRRSQWEGFGLGEYLGVPRQSSWANGTMPNVDRWTNEISVLSPVRPEGELTTLFRPEGSRLVTDVDLHFMADKLLFSMPDKKKRWQIYELLLEGGGAPSGSIRAGSGDGPFSLTPALSPGEREKPLLPNSEIGAATRDLTLRQLTPGDQPEVHCYDPCYLPNGKILFISTAVLQGVPCNAGVIVGMMYQMDGDGRNIRQICFEQDHDYNPSVMNDGRVLYLRWDYTDTPHVWNRILMTMNPDGTSQMACYGGSSYWPNAVFFPRSIPEHATKIAGIVTGHHEGRVGELTIFDPTKGTQETDGVVQQIPGRGQKVEPRIEDKLTEHSWPKFLHPWPLSENYFLVACKPEPDALWGIYLVDVFDNMVLLKEEENFALLEPVPFRARAVPPIIPDRVKPDREDALVYLEDIYQGPGLKDVPRGTVKSLRLFTYHFGYQTLAGIDHRVGADGPWETKRVLGTVPVEEDGSAWFRIPAKRPISLQPLDAEGKAVALMRSWMTAMPGENLSCVGCHEPSRTVPSARSAIALRRAPSEIAPWRGPTRGFSFAREVQPVLNKFCVRCHNGERTPDGREILDLRGDQDAYVVYERGKIDGHVIRGVSKKQLLGKYGAVFEPSYLALRQFVRVGGLESDLHLLPPKEFHADTSELVQMLQKGHYDVRLDDEAWDRLITWIDLNAPCHGTWSEVARLPGNQRERRIALRKLYGGVVEDCEELPEALTPTLNLTGTETGSGSLAPQASIQRVGNNSAALPLTLGLSPAERETGVGLRDEPNTAANAADGARSSLSQRERAGVRENAIPTNDASRSGAPARLPDWPFNADEARRRQAETSPIARTIDLGNGVRMEFVRIPAGTFLMGDAAGEADERPLSVVRIEQPFWMAKCEVSNEQFSRFDGAHDSRFEHRSSWIFSEEYLGWPLNRPRQPVVRVSWNEAMAFCDWLSKQLGERATLPTEAQWEYACRAGTSTPLFYGDLSTDFSRFANVADANLRRLADEGWRPKAPDLVPRDSRFDDGALVTTDVSHYLPNAWGLHDMHGNAAEWTRTTYRRYPYDPGDGRDRISSEGRKVVRGGSWRDRPKLCRSAFRVSYPAYQKVYNVGFRMIIEADRETVRAARK
ncbi:MAG: SUMF1/EgtB/PvdO family nonheme iron enzyme [Verrucomicrobia bacterium]|nr:SUMF1/EgtB/PvdO family nonheme iron enzyme [Verrucomicrobiota bacterium]